MNLVGNAIKFARNGHIVIGAKSITENYVEISVTDNGVGISKENQSRLFTSFGKLEDA